MKFCVFFCDIGRGIPDTPSWDQRRVWEAAPYVLPTPQKKTHQPKGCNFI